MIKIAEIAQELKISEEEIRDCMKGLCGNFIIDDCLTVMGCVFLSRILPREAAVEFATLHLANNIGYYNTGSFNSGNHNTGNRNDGNRNTGNGNIGDYNTGNHNTGNGNTGDSNTGNYNTGNYNAGNDNTGNLNTGNGNTGSRNTGHGNTGNRNDGDSNTGYGNTGSRNTGDYNTGNNNTGNSNAGNRNTGNDNAGSGNTGSGNTGDGNTGNWNTGNNNTGDWNKCHFATGCFNTVTPQLFFFNRPTDWTHEKWENSDAYYILKSMIIYRPIWVPLDKMTEEEEKAHPYAVYGGGYLKTDEAMKWWRRLSDQQRGIIMDLPNFDKDIFEEITGIKVD